MTKKKYIFECIFPFIFEFISNIIESIGTQSNSNTVSYNTTQIN